MFWFYYNRLPLVSHFIFSSIESIMLFSFDGEYYHSIESTKYSHEYTYGLGNYKGKALAVGCYSTNGCGFKTELLDMNTLKWSDGPDFPFGSKWVPKYHLMNLSPPITLFSEISEYSATQSPDAAYIIGGRYTQNLVAEFKNDQWRQLDDLNKGRLSHGSITIGTQTMIVGGNAQKWGMILSYCFGYEDSDFFLSFETEVWELENGNNKVITPTLSYYYYGIGLYAVDFNFCSYWVLNWNCVRE